MLTIDFFYVLRHYTSDFVRFLYSREVGIGTFVVTLLVEFLGYFDRTLCPAKYTDGQTLDNLSQCPTVIRSNALNNTIIVYSNTTLIITSTVSTPLQLTITFNLVKHWC